MLDAISTKIRNACVGLAIQKNLIRPECRGILFLAPHPQSVSGADGFQQRVSAIDSHFSTVQRWYVKVSLKVSPAERITRYPDGSMYIQIAPWNLLLFLAMVGILLHCGILYTHSAYGASRGMDTLLHCVPSVIRVFDMHGILPEECKYAKKRTWRFLLAERICFAKAHYVIAVTEQMVRHAQKKYPRYCFFSLVLPIFSGGSSVFATKKSGCPAKNQGPQFGYDTGEGEVSGAEKRIFPFLPEHTNKPGIIYAGGTQPWQLLPVMCKAIAAQPDLARYLILTPEPPALDNHQSRIFAHSSTIQMASATPEQVHANYPSFQYGFILREDHVVNNVACPTKLIEYLQNDLVPIMLSAQTGDFIPLGMQYLPLETMQKGILLTSQEYTKAIAKNREVLACLQQQHTAGIALLQTLVGALLARPYETRPV